MSPSLLHASDYSSQYGGNFIASLKVLEETCKGDDLRLVLVVPPEAQGRSWSRQWTEEGRSICYVPSSPTINTLRCAASLAKIASRENAAIIHTHFTQYDVPAWLASVWMGIRGRRPAVVWHSHSDFPVKQTISRRVKDWVKFRWMGRSANIIGVSEQTVKNALLAGYPPESLRIIPNGVDIRRSLSPGRTREEVVMPLHLDDEERLVLLFGWSPVVKGVDLAMDAVRRLAEEGRKVVLATVGTQEMVDYIKDRVGEHIPAWLRVLSPADNVADLYQIADVFLSASRNEGFPYSVCEAMGCGIPVVLSDIPGVAWAKQTTGAVFFPAGSSEDLVHALRQVLGWTPEQRVKTANMSQSFVINHYGIQQWADRIMQHYDEMLCAGESVQS